MQNLPFHLHHRQNLETQTAQFKSYPASRGFFLVSLLACAESFASLVFRVTGLFPSWGSKVNKLTTRNTRDVNDFVHAKRLATEKETSASRVTVFKVH